jgi:hypothetical protein
MVTGNQKPSGPGWVYVLTCADDPGVVKLGGTSRTAQHRAMELAVEYGTWHSFAVAAAYPVGDWWTVEQMAHRMLSDRRLPKSELFRCTAAEASRVIEAAASDYAKPSFSTVLLRRMMQQAAPRRPGSNWRHSYRRPISKRWRRYAPRANERRAAVAIGVAILAALLVFGPHIPARLPAALFGAAIADRHLPVIHLPSH